jgi:hypothetical protein
VLPPDELPAANPDETAAALASRRDRGRPFAAGNTAAKGRRPKLALLGVNLDATDPAYALCLRQASRWRKRRCSELAALAGGYLSAGASSLVASAALALASSRYLYGVAAKTGDPALMKQASALANDSRQNELAAHELCLREAAARPRDGEIEFYRVARELNGGAK